MKHTRIYRINDRLIEASSQAAAVHHAARTAFSVRVATQRDMRELRHIDVEVAGRTKSAGIVHSGPDRAEGLDLQPAAPRILPADEPKADGGSLRVAETDASGKATHLVLEA